MDANYYSKLWVWFFNFNSAMSSLYLNGSIGNISQKQIIWICRNLKWLKFTHINWVGSWQWWAKFSKLGCKSFITKWLAKWIFYIFQYWYIYSIIMFSKSNVWCFAFLPPSLPSDVSIPSSQLSLQMGPACNASNARH